VRQSPPVHEVAHDEPSSQLNRQPPLVQANEHVSPAAQVQVSVQSPITDPSAGGVIGLSVGGGSPSVGGVTGASVGVTVPSVGVVDPSRLTPLSVPVAGGVSSPPHPTP